tara:strand:+ start:70 stop:249 length:180 start_codon:yes stop_codon:yes gene_type:complete
MTLTKYATYRVFKHKTTGEIVRVAHTSDDKELEKVSELKDERCWIEMESDPEEDVENDA